MSCQKEGIKTLLRAGCRLERGKMVNGVKMGEMGEVRQGWCEQGEARWGFVTGAGYEGEVRGLLGMDARGEHVRCHALGCGGLGASGRNGGEMRWGGVGRVEWWPAGEVREG